MDSTALSSKVSFTRSSTRSDRRSAHLLTRRLSSDGVPDPMLTTCRRTHSSANLLFDLNIQEQQRHNSATENMSSPLTYRVSSASNYSENVYLLKEFKYDLPKSNAFVSSPSRSIPLKASRSEVKIIRPHTAKKTERMKWSIQKRKFVETIQTKMDLLNKEIYRLRINSKEMIEVNNHYSSLEQHAKFSAKECTEMQKYLSELTILQDMFIFKNLDSKLSEITELKKCNGAMQRRLERMCSERKKLEDKILSINKDLQINNKYEIHGTEQDTSKKLLMAEEITQIEKSNLTNNENLQNGTTNFKRITENKKIKKELSEENYDDIQYEKLVSKEVEMQSIDVIRNLDILSNKLMNIPSKSDFIKIIEDFSSEKVCENNIKSYRSNIHDLIQHQKKIFIINKSVTEEINSMNNKIHNLKKYVNEFISNKILNKTHKVRLNELQSKKDFLKISLKRNTEVHVNAKYDYDKIKSDFDNNKNKNILVSLESDLIKLSQIIYKLSEEKLEIEAKEPLSKFIKSTITLLNEINSMFSDMCVTSG